MHFWTLITSTITEYEYIDITDVRLCGTLVFYYRYVIQAPNTNLLAGHAYNKKFN